MATTIDLEEAHRDLKKLVAALISGAATEYLILKDGQAVARLAAPEAVPAIDEEKERARDLLTGA